MSRIWLLLILKESRRNITKKITSCAHHSHSQFYLVYPLTGSLTPQNRNKMLTEQLVFEVELPWGYRIDRGCLEAGLEDDLSSREYRALAKNSLDSLPLYLTAVAILSVQCGRDGASESDIGNQFILDLKIISSSPPSWGSDNTCHKLSLPTSHQTTAAFLPRHILTCSVWQPRSK